MAEAKKKEPDGFMKLVDFAKTITGVNTMGAVVDDIGDGFSKIKIPKTKEDWATIGRMAFSGTLPGTVGLGEPTPQQLKKGEQAVIDMEVKDKNPMGGFLWNVTGLQNEAKKADQKVQAAQQSMLTGSPMNKARAEQYLATVNGDQATPASGGFDFGFSSPELQGGFGAGSVAMPTIEGYRAATKKAESNGNYAAIGPKTYTGESALGAWQIMPQTGQALAKRLGVPWNPALMTATTPEGIAYQDLIGNAATEEAWKAGGGDPAKAATYYHAGPDPKMAGPKTAAYAANVAGLAGSGGPQGANGLTQLQAPNPMLAGLIPDPKQQGMIDLPTAPAFENPAEMQMLPEKTRAMIEPLLQAYGAQSKQTQEDVDLADKKSKRKGVDRALMYGSIGLASGNPLLALLGAGYGYTQGRNQGEIDDLTNRQQLSAKGKENLLLAALQEAGLMEDNYTVGNTNLDRGTLNEQGKIDTFNKNIDRQDLRDVQELTLNADVDAANIAAQNRADLAKATGFIDLVGDQYGVANQNAVRNDAYAQTNVGVSTPITKKMLSEIGISDKRTTGEDPGLELARRAASFIQANNVPGAFATFADEIVSSGLASEVLSDADLATYNELIKNKDKAGAAALVNQLLTQNPAVSKQLADALAQRGLPVAQLISKHGKTK